ncbi:MAG: DEAD/DEAH box helicase, partial [Pseudomonadota bacterium]
MKPFHHSIRTWFEQRYPSPTDVQVNAWPRIQTGEHLLITAPTGTGKTMTAFLWTLNRFATGDLALGATRVLYISPLKALNNDIAKNLLTPLSELREQFPDFPEVRVQTRSGDTEQQQRRRMVRHPPEILITTPESLNLMLSSASGLSMLGNIETVILDEIHAVVDSKRGVYLMTAIERLVAMSGEFQRIVLSATVNPLERVAAFVGGYQLDQQNRFTQRPVGIVRSDATKQFDIRIRYPEATANRRDVAHQDVCCFIGTTQPDLNDGHINIFASK